jgi:outer membrane protein
MRKFVAFTVLALGFFAAQAQTPQTPQKFGTADVGLIYSRMPESKQIEAELKTTQNMLKTQIEAKAQEFQKKLADYQQNGSTMLEAVRVNTERELQQLQQNLDKLQQDAQTTIQNKHAALMEPVFKKVGDAIADVAKENGYTFILTQQIEGLDVILYGDDKMDISELVLKKMGVNTAATTTPPPAPNAQKKN